MSVTAGSVVARGLRAEVPDRVLFSELDLVALDDYPGTILVISHDRRFVDALAPTRTIVVPAPG